MEMQSLLAQRVSRDEQTIVTGSSHFIQLDQPEVVIDSILTIVKAARNHSHVLSQPPTDPVESPRYSFLKVNGRESVSYTLTPERIQKL
jgi:hypothetical protein